MKKQSGSKITTSHTTYLEHCEPFVRYAERSALVEKITLGIITMTPRAKGGSRRIKYVSDKACLLLTVRANRGIQKLYFYCKSADDVLHLKSDILRVAQDNYFAIQT